MSVVSELGSELVIFDFRVLIFDLSPGQGR